MTNLSMPCYEIFTVFFYGDGLAAEAQVKDHLFVQLPCEVPGREPSPSGNRLHVLFRTAIGALRIDHLPLLQLINRYTVGTQSCV